MSIGTATRHIYGSLKSLTNGCFDSGTVAEMRNMSKSKAEVKRFRAERRACQLGETGSEALCSLPEGQCRLCTAIRTGFVYSLDLKRHAVASGAR